MGFLSFESMTDGIVKVDRKSTQHELTLSSESEIKVRYDTNQKDNLDMEHYTKPTKIDHKASQAIECEGFWCKCGPLRELLDYTISVFQKEKEIVVPLKILKGLIECLCMTKHVDIKLEDIESDVCGFKYKISNVKRVVAIFVERDGVMKNLKYDLSDEYNRLSTLRISLKRVY